MKKTISIFLAIILSFGCCSFSVFASERGVSHFSNAAEELYPTLPESIAEKFRSLAAEISASINTTQFNDYNKEIECGEQIAKMLEPIPDSDLKENFMQNLYYRMGNAAIQLKDFELARRYYKKCVETDTDKNFDRIVGVEEVILTLESDLELFEITNQTNDNSGILYGKTAEAKGSISHFNLHYKTNSIYSDLFSLTMKQTSENNVKYYFLLLEDFTLNSNYANALADTEYLDWIKGVIDQYKDVTVLIDLSYSILSLYCTPAEFKEMYKVYYDFFSTCENVKFIWDFPVVTGSETGQKYLDEYYPGDNMVDYIGVSMTVFRNDLSYLDIGENPVEEISQLVKNYGHKPIIIQSIGFVTEKIYDNIGTVSGFKDFAKSEMAESLTTLPMVYPQIKGVIVMDKYNHYDNAWRFGNNPGMQELFDETVKNDWFIQPGETTSQTTFNRITNKISANSSMKFAVYTDICYSDTLTVEYFIDDQLVHTTNTAPYVADLKEYRGDHILKVKTTNDKGRSITKYFTIGNAEITEPTVDLRDIYKLTQRQQDDINTLVKMGVISGYEDNTFRANNKITRAEFATIIAKLKKYPDEGKCSFTDSQNHWASNHINSCVKVEAINGIGNNLFNPDGNITLFQASKIVTIVSGLVSDNGSYPNDFLFAAYKNNLYDTLNLNMSRLEDYDLTRMEVVTIIANSLR